jgi:MtN3 and saliva related transmembrane protein
MRNWLMGFPLQVGQHNAILQAGAAGSKPPRQPRIKTGVCRMDWITLLGYAAATCTTFAFIPQLLKTWRSKSAGDVSWGMLIIFSAGLLLWLIYGIFLNAWPIIVANSITLGLNLLILGLKARHG